uniref:Synaptotagmin-like 2a n=1 Tax=Eptatretus burgeri TaxID=7764 RepID=A0A8C4QEU8_EPTBU
KKKNYDEANKGKNKTTCIKSNPKMFFRELGKQSRKCQFPLKMINLKTSGKEFMKIKNNITRISSMMSLYSEAGDFGKLPITGEVEFALRYNERGNELLVHVSRCRDLAPANEKKKRSDAYVKTYLLPDRSRQSKRKTVIKKKTLSPKYDEVLKYKIEKSDLANRILNLSVWHNDMFGRNVFLGEVNLILNSWDWTNQTLNWYSLLLVPFLDGKKPASGEIHIWIQNAYNLVPVRSQGVDSFVKCYILPDTSRQSRQKTRVVRKNCNPEYNHTMVYDGFQAEDLNEACIELTIWDYERFSTNQFLGGVRLSFGKGMSYGKAVDWMDSQGEEIRLYKKLLETPNEWNQGILPLRPQMATAQNPSK